MKTQASSSNTISQKSIKKNTIFNFFLTFANVLFPFITTPYISRVLNIEDIGIINQGSVFSTLFINLISLGVTGYGAREIARVRNDIEKLNKIFFSVLSLHIFAFILGSFFYFGYSVVFITEIKLKQVYFIYYFLLAINPFMIEWFYTGLEEFKYIALRSIAIKTLMFILLFVFVRNEKDFLQYAILLVSAQGANGIFNIIHVRKYISFRFFKLDLRTVLSGSKYFYLQTLVAICYQNLNQLVLGNSDKVQLALYVRATTLIAVISSCVNPIMNAVKPRLENIIALDKVKYNFYIKKCFDTVMFILFPLCFGMAALSKNIMFFFGGEQFVIGSDVLKIVSFSALVSNLSVFFNNIISTPAGFERNTLFGNISVALFSLILNPLLIVKIGAEGAAIAMLVSETSGLFVQIIFIKRQKIFLSFISWKTLKYFVSSFAMYFAVYILSTFIEPVFISILVCIFTGAVVYLFVYLICGFLFKDKNDFVLGFLKKYAVRGRK